MLYEHSGRIGFESLEANAAVPTPAKHRLCAMLRRETELRNCPAAQQLLDAISCEGGCGQSLEEARKTIAALRAAIAGLESTRLVPASPAAYCCVKGLGRIFGRWVARYWPARSQ